MNPYLIMPIIQAVMSFGLATVIGIKGHPRLISNRLFLVLLVCLGLWGILIYFMRTSSSVESALVWERVLMPVVFVVPAVFYHFSVTLTHTRVPSWVIPALYIIAVAAVPLTFTGLFIKKMVLLSYGYAPVFGPLMILSFLLIFVLSILAISYFFRVTRTSPDSNERARAVYVIFGIIILIIGGAFDILPVFGLPLYPGFIIGSISFSLMATIAILKHDFLDLHLALKRSFVYILSAATFLVLTFIVFLLIFDRSILFSQWSHIIIISAEILILPFLWVFFEGAVDRFFTQGRYTYFKALEVVAKSTFSVRDKELGATFIKLIAKAMRVKYAYLLLPNFPQGSMEVGFTNNGRPEPDIAIDIQSPLMKIVARRGVPMSRHELDLMPQFIGRDRATLNSIGTELLVPGKTVTGNFTGLVLLGAKLNQRPFTSEEKYLVQSLLNQIATKLENIRLYNEAINMRQELQNLSSRLVEIQEQERREIARELHDEIGQSLILAKMILDKTVKSAGGACEQLSQVQSTLQEVIEQVRQMSLNLRPSVLDDLGIIAAIDWYIERLNQRAGIKVTAVYKVKDLDLSGNLKTVVYRSIQEALNNIAKHARTDRAQLTLAVKKDKLHIEISDNGIGFDPGKIELKSNGLRGMRERINIINGKIEIDSSPGHGTWIGIDIPLIESGENGQESIIG